MIDDGFSGTVYTDDVSMIMTDPVETTLSIFLQDYVYVEPCEETFNIQILDPCPDTILTLDTYETIMDYIFGDPAKTQTLVAKDSMSLAYGD